MENTSVFDKNVLKKSYILASFQLSYLLNNNICFDIYLFSLSNGKGAYVPCLYIVLLKQIFYEFEQ